MSRWRSTAGTAAQAHSAARTLSGSSSHDGDLLLPRCRPLVMLPLGVSGPEMPLMRGLPLDALTLREGCLPTSRAKTSSPIAGAGESRA